MELQPELSSMATTVGGWTPVASTSDKDGAPARTIFHGNDSGWMDSGGFNIWQGWSSSQNYLPWQRQWVDGQRWLQHLARTELKPELSSMATTVGRWTPVASTSGKDGAQAGTIFHCNDSGWMDSDGFNIWQGWSSSRNYLPWQRQWVDGQRWLQHLARMELKPELSSMATTVGGWTAVASTSGKDGAPARTIFHGNDSGWMDSDGFNIWQGRSSSRNYLPWQRQWVDGQRWLQHLARTELQPELSSMATTVGGWTATASTSGKDGAQAGTIFHGNDSGWMDSDGFNIWQGWSSSRNYLPWQRQWVDGQRWLQHLARTELQPELSSMATTVGGWTAMASTSGKDGAQAGTIFHGNDSGWMDSDGFNIWQGRSSSRNYLPWQRQWVDGQRRLQHLAAPLHLNREAYNPRSKCCYCWMGTCHIRRTWKRSSRPCESGVIMLSLQPHKAHRLHPVDVSFFKPLQTYYGQEGEKWLRSHAGRGITRGITTYHISELLGAAYLRGATMANAVNGFSKCSICPCDRYAFDDELQLISSTTPAPPMCPTSSVSLAPDPATQGTGSAYWAAAYVGDHCYSVAAPM